MAQESGVRCVSPRRGPPCPRYVRRRPADEADPAWLVYRIDPAAAVRPPREWDVLPRLGWALRYLRHGRCRSCRPMFKFLTRGRQP